VIVISDLIGTTGWRTPLKALPRRHDVIVVEVVDPRELELPAVGALRVVDPESGRELEVHTTPALRQRFPAAAQALACHLSARRRKRSARTRQLRGAA
jgi:hypothetical protein